MNKNKFVNPKKNKNKRSYVSMKMNIDEFGNKVPTKEIKNIPQVKIEKLKEKK